jgi:hypothetical protein
MQVFNAITQQLEDVEWSVDHNNEILATFADGHFYKFPAGLSKDELEVLVDAHKANEGQEVITPEIEAAQEAEKAEAVALVDELNGVEAPADVPETPKA